MVAALVPVLRSTEEKNRLATENIRLVSFALRKLSPGLIGLAGGPDEAFSVGCLALLRACGRWNPERGALSSYVVKCVRLAVLTAARRRGQRREVQAAEGFDVAAPESRLRQEDLEELEHALGKLRPRLALLVRLYFLEALTLDQVGEQLGLTGERVRQLLGKALAALRRCMDPERGPRPGRRREACAAG